MSKKVRRRWMDGWMDEDDKYSVESKVKLEKEGS